jgi:hypothetical protein
MFKKKSLLIVLLFLSVAQKITKQNSCFLNSGRVENLADDKVILIGSALSVSYNFKGNSCAILLQSVDVEEHHNYVALELDGEYIGRLKIEKGVMQSYPIIVPDKKEKHHLTIYKATESANGKILFSGTSAQLTQSRAPENKKKIELIGDSYYMWFWKRCVSSSLQSRVVV